MEKFRVMIKMNGYLTETIIEAENESDAQRRIESKKAGDENFIKVTSVMKYTRHL